jgi:ADP-heptose:LPS heptosyltransferase
LIDYPLPHSVQENEYANNERVADYLGCRLDPTVYGRLRSTAIDGLEDAVVLATTTICRWRNWPLANFLALVERFPTTHFAVTGFTNEVLPEELPTLAKLLGKPNVSGLFDTLPLGDLIRLIAHSRAVVTNDTSTAHIANGFSKPGAVLFGPARPETFTPRDGKLRAFADTTCPFRPCVQWRCSNQQNWCMRKISVDDVADHLATVLEASTAVRLPVPELIST